MRYYPSSTHLRIVPGPKAILARTDCTFLWRHSRRSWIGVDQVHQELVLVGRIVRQDPFVCYNLFHVYIYLDRSNSLLCPPGHYGKYCIIKHTFLWASLPSYLRLMFLQSTQSLFTSFPKWHMLWPWQNSHVSRLFDDWLCVMSPQLLMVLYNSQPNHLVILGGLFVSSWIHLLEFPSSQTKRKKNRTFGALCQLRLQPSHLEFPFWTGLKTPLKRNSQLEVCVRHCTCT